MRVLVIPEDQELDRYIVKPVVERLFENLGRKAQVDVLPEPRLRGASDALDPELIARIVADNEAMIDMFLLVVDRDCDRQQHTNKVQAREREHRALIGCLAIEEIECWLLAAFEAHALPAAWREIRKHCDPKEAFAEPLIARIGATGPGRGRKAAMRQATSNWARIWSRCPELQELQDRVHEWLTSNATV